MYDDTIEIDGDLHRMTGRPFYSGAAGGVQLVEVGARIAYYDSPAKCWRWYR